MLVCPGCESGDDGIESARVVETEDLDDCPDDAFGRGSWRRFRADAAREDIALDA